MVTLRLTHHLHVISDLLCVSFSLSSLAQCCFSSICGYLFVIPNNFPFTTDLPLKKPKIIFILTFHHKLRCRCVQLVPFFFHLYHSRDQVFCVIAHFTRLFVGIYLIQACHWWPCLFLSFSFCSNYRLCKVSIENQS